MIKRLTIRNFKLLKEEIFDLEDTIVLAGPNNKGKSTVLQAIATWFFTLHRWLEIKGQSTGKKQRSVPITRSSFTALPLREFKLLWTDADPYYSKKEEGGKAGFPKLIEIEIEGTEYDPISKVENKWSLSMALRPQSREQIYAYPVLDSDQGAKVPEGARKLNVVHVPCFSGIGIDETRYDPGRQNKLIGEGKPGDILRNLLVQIHRDGVEGEWDQLVSTMKDLFCFTLLPPMYSPDMPSILCEYLPGLPKTKGLPRLDIASAGSGFHQALILFSFFLARPATVLLLDEPDAHLHVILQRDVFDTLKTMARRKGCQLVVATHSEVLIDATAATDIISFFHKPHRLLSPSERDQTREALKRVSSLEVMLAEQSGLVLYLEGETDYKILREFARHLDHPAKGFFENGFFHSNNGANPREGKAHLFSLRAINPGIQGLMLLDRDNRNLPGHELSSEGMQIARWQRYEIENYLLIPQALQRFCASVGGGGISTEGGGQLDLFAEAFRSAAEDFIKRQFVPDAIVSPLEDLPFLSNLAASKDLLPMLFDQVGISVNKKDYYQIVSYLKPEEVHPEIVEKLDLIHQSYELTKMR